MTEKLQKIIASAGLMSRRAAEEAILAGRVTLNGRTAALGDRADASLDEILVDGGALPGSGEKLYLMLHKPRGVVTTMNDEKGRRSVAGLVAELGVRVYPIGRLDLNSEGLLLMTNDGDFANRVSHPSHEIDKCYHTWIEGPHPERAAELLSRPMRIDGHELAPARVRLIRPLGETAALLSITIHEGRNRQIRKMCEQAGFRVRRLLRVSEGAVQLGELPPGKWRMLTKEEIASFD